MKRLFALIIKLIFSLVFGLLAFFGGFILILIAHIIKEGPLDPIGVFFLLIFGLGLLGVALVNLYRVLTAEGDEIIFELLGKRKRRREYIYNDSEEAIIRAGEQGEAEVSYVLKWLPGDKYKVYNDIALKVNGYETQQFDHIVVGDNGVFHIETKNYSGKIVIYPNGNWVREKEGKTEGLENPSFQVLRHRRVLEELLGGHVPIVDVVVIANKGAIIEGSEHSTIPVIKSDVLLHFIENHKGTIDPTMRKQIENKINNFT
ncbi:Nuclease-related domain-containing protein (plasmid) [Carboxydocella thermautotrophica]|nr:Nuclease-related domain-containing protein [Carboxydocella thermautotrophica]